MDASDIIILVVVIIAVVIGIIVGRKKQRYHESGQGADEKTLRDFGTPAKSLYTSTKILTLHHHIDITDDQDRVVYQSNSKVISIRDKTDITRADGSPVAHIEKKLLTLREVHYVTMADGTEFQLSREILHIIKDVTNIVGLGWRLEGNILQLNFVLRDENGRVIAAVGQKLFSVHDKYCLDIYVPQYEEIAVAILITLQHMIVDRRNAEAASEAGGVATAGALSQSSDRPGR